MTDQLPSIENNKGLTPNPMYPPPNRISKQKRREKLKRNVGLPTLDGRQEEVKGHKQKQDTVTGLSGLVQVGIASSQKERECERAQLRFLATASNVCINSPAFGTSTQDFADRGALFVCQAGKCDQRDRNSPSGDHLCHKNIRWLFLWGTEGHGWGCWCGKRRSDSGRSVSHWKASQR
jgi:hypothetical protein